MKQLNTKQLKSLEAFRSYVGSETFTKSDYNEFKVKLSELGVISPRFLFRNNFCEKIARGVYRFPEMSDGIPVISESATVEESTPPDIATTTLVSFGDFKKPKVFNFFTEIFIKYMFVLLYKMILFHKCF